MKDYLKAAKIMEEVCNGGVKDLEAMVKEIKNPKIRKQVSSLADAIDNGTLGKVEGLLWKEIYELRWELALEKKRVASIYGFVEELFEDEEFEDVVYPEDFDNIDVYQPNT